MTEVVSLRDLAAEINREHQRCEAGLRTAVESAARAGSLLTEAKRQIEHGGWLAWLDENFAGSARSAQGYMRLAAANTQGLAHLGVEGALRELAAPREADPLDRLEAAVRNGEFHDLELFERLYRETHAQLLEELSEAAGSREVLMAVRDRAGRWANLGGEMKVRAERELGRLLVATSRGVPS